MRVPPLTVRVPTVTGPERLSVPVAVLMSEPVPVTGPERVASADAVEMVPEPVTETLREVLMVAEGARVPPSKERGAAPELKLASTERVPARRAMGPVELLREESVRVPVPVLTREEFPVMGEPVRV